MAARALGRSVTMTELGLAIGTVCTVVAELGEGPYWDVESSTLLWVDIPGGLLHRTDPVTGDTQTADIGAPLSAALPVSGGGVLLARQSSLILLSSGDSERVVAATADRDDIRFNDGSVDPAGRVWIGSMDIGETSPTGQLYRLSPDGSLDAIVTGVTVSNGLGWSPDGRLMYYVDSPTRRVDAFTFDASDGGLAGRRVFADVSEAPGVPDGLTVDASGYVWVAMHGGGALRRYAPDGSLDSVVTLPVSHPTSCAFGGPDLRDLFITTARAPLSPQQRAAQPMAGRLLRMHPGVGGQPAASVRAAIAG
jgi:sugar lactone lactonase YvrE